jgi:hypothetical protein
MNPTLHLTSGDIAGDLLSKTGIAGEVFVWHDILYDGPRVPGWPEKGVLQARARFLEEVTSGGLGHDFVLKTLVEQYAKLERAGAYERVVLWFDACLFDQAMLCHVLACLAWMNVRTVDLLCVDAFPGLDPYHGLGQLTPEQLASVYDRRRSVTGAQFVFAREVDRAFALQDLAAFASLAERSDAPLPWVPAAVRRWLAEQPDPETGLGRLEQMALDAVVSGHHTPAEIFTAVACAEIPPQFWGDVTLWAKINALADRKPPLLRIHGPQGRLPQWPGGADIKQFRVFEP